MAHVIENVISIKPPPICVVCGEPAFSIWHLCINTPCIYDNTKAYLEWTKHLQEELKVSLTLKSTVVFQVGPFYEG